MSCLEVNLRIQGCLILVRFNANLYEFQLCYVPNRELMIMYFVKNNLDGRRCDAIHGYLKQFSRDFILLSLTCLIPTFLLYAYLPLLSLN